MLPASISSADSPLSTSASAFCISVASNALPHYPSIPVPRPTCLRYERQQSNVNRCLYSQADFGRRQPGHHAATTGSLKSSLVQLNHGDTRMLATQQFVSQYRYWIRTFNLLSGLLCYQPTRPPTHPFQPLTSLHPQPSPPHHCSTALSLLATPSFSSILSTLLSRSN